jgi:hypothetical protein
MILFEDLAGARGFEPRAPIGARECPRFTSMTWKERDALIAKPDDADVRTGTKCIWFGLAASEQTFSPGTALAICAIGPNDRFLWRCR